MKAVFDRQKPCAEVIIHLQKFFKEAVMAEKEGVVMSENYGMMPKFALVWAAVAVFVALAGGYALGMHFEKGELKKPVAGASYELDIVAKSGKGISTRYYSFGKYYSSTADPEKDLVNKKAIFENGAFRILELPEKKK